MPSDKKALSKQLRAMSEKSVAPDKDDEKKKGKKKKRSKGPDSSEKKILAVKMLKQKIREKMGE